MKTTINAPYCEVYFTSAKGDSFFIEQEGFGKDILAIRTSKTISEPAGTFFITLTAKKFYKGYFKSLTEETHAFKIFRPTCLVDIRINGKEVMLGIVDSVSKSDDFSTGKPMRSITVSGRDLGAFLVDHKIWSTFKIVGNRLNNTQMGYNIFQMNPDLGGQNLARVFQDIYNKWMIEVLNAPIDPSLFGDENDGRFLFADGDTIEKKLVGIVENRLDPYQVYVGPKRDSNVESKSEANTAFFSKVQGPGCLSAATYAINYPIMFHPWNFQGDLMNAFKAMISEPLNELYVDTGDAKVVLGNVRKSSNNFFNQTGVVGDETVIDRSASREAALPLTVKKGVRIQQMQKRKAYIIYRATPFDDEFLGIEPNNMDSMLCMQDLIPFQVDDSEIVSKNISRNKNGIPSFYHVFPDNAIACFGAGKWFMDPEYDERALRRYGYTPMEVKLNALDIHKMKCSRNTEPLKDLCSRYQKKINSWYSKSDMLLNGVMNIKGNERIRIGNRLDYVKLNGSIEDEYLEGYYYITGVDQNYGFGVSFSTTVTLSRGVSYKLMKGELSSKVFNIPFIA